MRNIFILSLLIFSLYSHASEDFFCKNVYEKKILKNEKIIKAMGYTFAGVGLSSGIYVASTVTISWIILVPLNVLLPGLLVGGVGFMTFALPVEIRTASIRETYELQTLLDVKQQVIIDELIKSREQRLKEKLEIFDNRMTYPHLVKELTENVNRQRLAQSLPPLTAQEAIDLTRQQITKQIMDEKIILQNSLSYSLEYLKKKHFIDESVTYEDWRIFLNNNQKLFCPEGKALRYKRAIKKFAKIYSSKGKDLR